MTAMQDLIKQAFETNWEWTERYIDGLSQEEIEYRPNDQCHSIGFILWHYGRALDRWVQSRAKGESSAIRTRAGRNAWTRTRTLTMSASVTGWRT